MDLVEWIGWGIFALASVFLLYELITAFLTFKRHRVKYE